MKRLISALAMCIILGLGTVSSQEDATLPSQTTWNEIENSTTPTQVYDNVNPSLRAGPPGGPSIGETPTGEASLAGFILVGLVYFAFKRKRTRNNPI